MTSSECGEAVRLLINIIDAQRKEFKRKCKGLIMIQAHIKGFVTKKHYRFGKVNRRE